MEKGFRIQPDRLGMYSREFEHDACGIGFIVDVEGRKSHDIVEDAIQVLVNLHHRGGIGADPECGDGAGIIMQLPHAFLKEACSQEKIDLPESGQYGVGNFFLPHGRGGDARRQSDHCGAPQGD